MKKKVELESLQERVIALMKENEKLKIMANMRIPSPVSAEILMSCDFHLPDNVTEAVRNIIANDATTAINELKTKQRSFCIINAIASDYPIVYASPGFLKLTGYEMKEVLGRNCRFLQGQNTDTEEVNIVKAATVMIIILIVFITG